MVLRRQGSHVVEIVGSQMAVSLQPYASAALHFPETFVFLLLRPEVLGKFIQIIHLTGSEACDLQACNIAH